MDGEDEKMAFEAFSSIAVSETYPVLAMPAPEFQAQLDRMESLLREIYKITGISDVIRPEEG